MSSAKTGRQMISLIISTIRSFCFSQAAKQARIYLGMGAELPEHNVITAPRSASGRCAGSQCPAHKSPAKGAPKLWWPLMMPVLVQTRVPHPQEGPPHQIWGKRRQKSPQHMNHSVGSHLQASTKPWRGPRASLASLL